MKKVLSFVLILALVLGSFSFAFGLSDIEDSANTEAITVASDLGIIKGFPDGTFKPEQTVNRAEFAAMITRALAVPDSALAAYSATSFKDTSGYGWAVPYLAFCESKGIMIGDGMGNVMPGRTINVNEAITMAVRAIGYTENSSMLVGTWPANYVTLAQTLGLYDDVAAATMVSRESAAQVIYNALTVNLVTVNADGETKESTKTMLTAGLGCEAEAAAVITGTEESNINLQKYVGAYAIKYTKDNEIIAIGQVKSTFLTVDSYTASDGYFKIADGTKYYMAAALGTTTRALFVNGAYISTTIIPVADDDIIAVDLTGKTVNTVYSSATWSVSDDFVFEEDMVSDEDINGNDFTLTDSDAIDYNSFQLMGATSLDAIPVDAVVYVYTAGTPAEVTKVVVGTETVTGTVTKTATVDSVLNYYIDGVAYTVASTSTVAPAVGSKGTATLDYFGDIYDWDVTDDAANNYAVVVDSGNIADAYGTTTYYVTLTTSDGTETEYACASTATKAASSLDSNDVVKFALNTSGKVKEITKVGTTSAGALDGGSISATIIGTTPIASSAVIWTYDSTNEVYVVKAATDLDDDQDVVSTRAINAYVKDGKIVAMYADSSYFGGTSDVYAVINDLQSAYYAEDETVEPYMVGLVDGAAYEAFIDTTGTAVVSTTGSGNALKVLTVDADGFVDIAAPSVGHSTTNNVWAQHLTSTTVTGVDSGMLKVQTGATTYAYYTIAPSAVVYVWDTDDEVFVVKTASTSVLKNKTVHLYQTIEDAAGYDILIAW